MGEGPYSCKPLLMSQIATYVQMDMPLYMGSLSCYFFRTTENQPGCSQFLPDVFPHVLFQLEQGAPSFRSAQFPGQGDPLPILRPGGVYCGLCLPIEFTPRKVEQILPELQRVLTEETDLVWISRQWAKLVQQHQQEQSDFKSGIYHVLEQIQQQGVPGGVREMEVATGYSARQLYNLFHDWFGMGSQGYLRLLRFRRSLDVLYSKETSPSKVATSVGYFDQSHYVREFRHFTSSTPTRYLKAVGKIA